MSVSVRIYFTVVDVVEALRGTPDYRRVVGVCPAAVTHWELSELAGSGVSLDGVCRVLRQAEMKRVPVREEEPGSTARVLLQQVRNLCDIVLRFVDLPCVTGDCQCNQGSASSLGVVVGAPDPNEEAQR